MLSAHPYQENACVEGGEGYLVGEGVRLFLEEMYGEPQRAEAAVPF